MNRFAKAFLITLAVMLAATTMFAVQPKANISVTANISPNCLISANTLAFGNYDELGVNSTTDLAQTTTITVQCVDEMTASVSLDQGLYPKSGSSHDTPQRQMQCTDLDGSFLAYFLYQDANHQQVWGDGQNNTETVTADNLPHNYTVYGVVPHGQMGEAESYADTVVATVLY